MSTATTSHRVGAGGSTELLTWCRRLTAAGPDADPSQRTAYLATKADPTRITAPDPHPAQPGHDHKEQW